ncbi:MAG: hypothetical protein ACOY33_12310 [Pseudomonadota bacterium]
MKTPFLHLVKRLATATPAGWFPACLQEATGYTSRRLDGELPAGLLASREERLRPRRLVSTGALFAAPGLPPTGGLVILPAATADSPVTAADRLHGRLAESLRTQLDAALADPRLLAHLDLGAPATSIAGAAGLQFLRDRHAAAVGHFLRGTSLPAGDDTCFDATSVCVQLAGLPPPVVLWLAAAIAAEAQAAHALVATGDDDALHLIERQRPPHVLVH